MFMQIHLNLHYTVKTLKCAASNTAVTNMCRHYNQIKLMDLISATTCAVYLGCSEYFVNFGDQSLNKYYYTLSVLWRPCDGWVLRLNSSALFI